MSPYDTELLMIPFNSKYQTQSPSPSLLFLELHPHEWVPFHEERVWSFNSTQGTFSASQQSVGIHITHNGDFDALEVSKRFFLYLCLFPLLSSSSLSLLFIFICNLFLFVISYHLGIQSNNGSGRSWSMAGESVTRTQ